MGRKKTVMNGYASGGIDYFPPGEYDTYYNYQNNTNRSFLQTVADYLTGGTSIPYKNTINSIDNTINSIDAVYRYLQLLGNYDLTILRGPYKGLSKPVKSTKKQIRPIKNLRKPKIRELYE